MNHNVPKLAACSVALSALAIGCTPATQHYRPASLASATPEAEKDATRLYEQAQKAVAAGKLGAALALAERAVEATPRDVGYRMLLADLYLKNGRFASAESSFADVVALDPGNVRGSLSLALTLVAQGKTGLAIAELDKLDGSAAPGDLGLAFALAGQHERGRALLEGAASAPGATGRVRQNLALVYALAGDWQKARATAAQDVSPAELPQRLEHWASLANPANSYSQVAALLGVNPIADAGRPERLALSTAEQTPVALAEAVPEAPVVPVVASAPVAVADASAAPASTPLANVGDAVQLAAAAEALVKPSPVLLKALLQTAPLPAFKPARVVRQSAPSSERTGRFVVQIGAFRNLNQANLAWGQATRRLAVGNKQPLTTTVNLPGRGTFYRLSIAPFDAPAQAARACQTIRAQGGACFVRAVAGDAPLQYAMRRVRRG
ncbi:MAG TPA: tetratricopeptide repeat protein [Allosphingosinicella sp.]|jgi:Flp pilus assembly protein TadD